MGGTTKGRARPGGWWGRLNEGQEGGWVGDKGVVQAGVRLRIERKESRWRRWEGRGGVGSVGVAGTRGTRGGAALAGVGGGKYHDPVGGSAPSDHMSARVL